MDDASQKESPINPSIKLQVDPSHEISQPDEKLLMEKAEDGVTDDIIRTTAENWGGHEVHHNLAKANDYLRIASQQSELRSSNKEDSTYYAQEATSAFARQQTLEQTQRNFDSGSIVDRAKQNLTEFASSQSVTHRASASIAGDGWGMKYSDALSTKDPEEVREAGGTEPETLESIGQEITEEIVEKENQFQETEGTSVQSEEPIAAPAEKPEEQQSIQDVSSSETQTLDTVSSELHVDPEPDKEVAELVKWREEPAPSHVGAKPVNESDNKQISDEALQAAEEDGKQSQVADVPQPAEQKPEEGVGVVENAASEKVPAPHVGEVLESLSKQIEGEAEKAGGEVTSQIGVGENIVPISSEQPDNATLPTASDVIQDVAPSALDHAAATDTVSQAAETPLSTQSVEQVATTTAVTTAAEKLPESNNAETAVQGVSKDIERVGDELEKAKAAAAAILSEGKNTQPQPQAVQTEEVRPIVTSITPPATPTTAESKGGLLSRFGKWAGKGILGS